MTVDSWKRELDRLITVLSAWYEASDGNSISEDQASQYRSFFFSIGGGGDPSGALKVWGRHSDRDDWNTLHGYFKPEPVATKGRDGEPGRVLWPAVSICLRQVDRNLEATFRLVIYSADESGIVDAWGWRFESADPDLTVESHPYSHIQHITSWKPGWLGFVAPDFPPPEPGSEYRLLAAPKTIPETKPAIPINCSTPAGLVVAMIISVYGGRRAAAMLGAISLVDGEFYTICGRQKSELLRG